MELIQICENARTASRALARLDAGRKNEVLRACAKALTERSEYVLEENAKDLAAARAKGMKESLLDRLMLTDAGQGLAATSDDAISDDPDSALVVPPDHLNASSN